MDCETALPPDQRPYKRCRPCVEVAFERINHDPVFTNRKVPVKIPLPTAYYGFSKAIEAEICRD
jgi:hypothetical protein